MSLTALAKLIIEWKKRSKNISPSDWPTYFYLEDDSRKAFQRIAKFSTSGNTSLFNKRTGSTGNEYSVTIGYFIDRLYYSEPTRGDYVSVVPSTRLSATPVQEGNSAYFNLVVGESNFKTPKYEIDKLQNIDYGIIMIAHTHPRVYFEDDSYIHTFFSPADINFLRHTQAQMLSIVTEKGVWVACKTSSSISLQSNDLAEITRLEKEASREEMKDYISSNLKNSGLVFYEGGINSKLYKI